MTSKRSKLPQGYYLAPSFFFKYPVLYDTLGPCLRLPELWARVVSAAAPHPGERVLDICSGTGAVALMMAKRLQGEGCVVAIDLTPQMVRRAKGKAKHHPLYVVRGWAEALPFADSSFHKVTISLALHEMPREARGRVLAEISRVTTAGGRVVVGEFWPSRKWYVRLFDMLFEEPQWVTEMEGIGDEMQQAGLRVVSRMVLDIAHFQVVVAEKGGNGQRTDG